MEGATAKAVRVLDEDPELGQGLNEQLAARARRALIARVVSVPCGRWYPPDLTAGIGFLVLGGLVRRDVYIDEATRSVELLAHGDLLRPHTEDPVSSLPTQVEWVIVDKATMAVLDRDFAAAVGQFPDIISALVARMAERSYRNSVNRAIAAALHVRTRLIGIFWELADRWGKVTPDGVVIELPLTHETLAGVVGARRPSVTTALQQLHDEGTITRVGRTRWLLHGEPPSEQEDFRSDRS